MLTTEQGRTVEIDVPTPELEEAATACLYVWYGHRGETRKMRCSSRSEARSWLRREAAACAPHFTQGYIA